MSDPKDLLRNVRWLGHASILVEGSRTVYVDPWEVSAAEPADLILITHDHYDHCSPPDVQRLVKPEGIVVGPEACRAKVGRPMTAIEPGSRITAAGIEIEAVRAYNPAKQFHPKKMGGMGYLFTVDGVRFYHAGDTDVIPEMKGLEADVAFLPVGGTYTMDVDEAIQAVGLIRARVVVPMHYAKIVGSEADAKRFAKLSKVPAVVLPKT
jgi:L-ascorbate metabolism protein UlaG (beta-lactamase superfamily)